MEYFSTGPLITKPDLWPTRCCKQISEILQFMHSIYVLQTNGKLISAAERVLRYAC